MLLDVLDVTHSDNQDEFEPKLEPETLSKITINWELPEVGWITTISSCLTWLLQVINIDGRFDMAKDAHVPATMTTVIRPSMDGFPHQTYLPSDTDILASPQACLNNTCINGCATLLYSVFLPAAASCAVLSTHDLPISDTMLMTKHSGAMCHGLTSGRSPSGSFQSIICHLWDIGCFD